MLLGENNGRRNDDDGRIMMNIINCITQIYNIITRYKVQCVILRCILIDE